MGKINVPFGDVSEEKVAPEGTYDLRVIRKEWVTSRNSGRPMLSAYIAIESDDGEAYTPFGHWCVLPTDEDWQEDRRKAEMFVRNLRRFLSVFGVEWTPDGFDDEELDGATGRCLVTIEEDDEGVLRNRLRLPRVQA